jgi:hypothetical protein
MPPAWCSPENTMTRERPGNEPEDASSLNSAEYRQRLLNKLTCLITVLEVAIGKISKSMTSDDANHDRLLRIKSNLENTLSICRRAKETLESRVLESTDAPAASSSDRPALPAPRRATAFRCYVELSSIDEFRKFKDLPAISDQDLRGADIEDLLRQLTEGQD